MTDLTKNFNTLSFGDLVDVCKRKSIKVAEGDNRESLLEKLKPASKEKKPVKK